MLTSLDFYKLIFMLELLVSEFVYTYKLKRRSHFPLRFAAVCAVCFVTAFFFPILGYDAIFSSIMFLLLFAVSVFALAFCFDESVVNIFFCGIAAYTTRHLAFQLYGLLASAGGNALGTLFGITVNNGVDSINGIYGSGVVDIGTLGLETVFWSIIYFVVYVAVYALMFLLFGRRLWKNDDLKIKSTSFLMLVGFVLLVDIFLNAVLVYNNSSSDMLYTFVMYMYNILCCLLTLYMQFSMISMKKLEKELTVVSHLWKQKGEQYELAKENIDLINLKCHDLKHQIRQIGQHESMSSKSIAEIENLISIYDSTVKTGNEALDVILTEKSLICRKNSIGLTCIADGARLGFMAEADIYSLFGNLIDNAMEAVLKLPSEKRFIGLSVHPAHNIMEINVNNYYDGKIRLDEHGLPVTTKRDDDYHGFGMKSIRMVVAKYDGDLTITTEEGVFDVNILLLATQGRREDGAG